MATCSGYRFQWIIYFMGQGFSFILLGSVCSSQRRWWVCVGVCVAVGVCMRACEWEWERDWVSIWAGEWNSQYVSACVNWDGVCVGKKLVKLNCLSVCDIKFATRLWEREGERVCAGSCMCQCLCVCQEEREAEEKRTREIPVKKSV